MATPRKWPRGPYAYLFCYPEGTPYYAGVGKGDRVRTVSRNRWANRIDSKIQKSGRKTLRIIVEFETREEACVQECAWIRHYGRRYLGGGLLVNMTEGGEGTKGLVWTAAMRASVGNKLRGKSWSLERREAQSIALRGNKNALGHKHTTETRARMSASLRGKKLRLSPAEIARRAAWAAELGRRSKGVSRRFTAEHKANIGKARKERYLCT